MCCLYLMCACNRCCELYALETSGMGRNGPEWKSNNVFFCFVFGIFQCWHWWRPVSRSVPDLGPIWVSEHELLICHIVQADRFVDDVLRPRSDVLCERERERDSCSGCWDCAYLWEACGTGWKVCVTYYCQPLFKYSVSSPDLYAICLPIVQITRYNLNVARVEQQLH